jgi:hypothetical protein
VSAGSHAGSHAHLVKLVCSPATFGVAHRWAHEDAAVQLLGSTSCFIPSHIRTPRLWPPASLRSPPRWYVTFFQRASRNITRHQALLLRADGGRRTLCLTTAWARPQSATCGVGTEEYTVLAGRQGSVQSFGSPASRPTSAWSRDGGPRDREFHQAARPSSAASFGSAASMRARPASAFSATAPNRSLPCQDSAVQVSNVISPSEPKPNP